MIIFNYDSSLVFLVACYATLLPFLSVGWLVGRLVGHTSLLRGPRFFPSNGVIGYSKKSMPGCVSGLVFYSLTILLLPNCSGELKYGPCPSARDWGNHVSGLVGVNYTNLRKTRSFMGRFLIKTKRNNLVHLLS